MYPVSTQFLAAIGSSHVAVIYCDAWKSGLQIATDLPVIGGAVTIDAGSDIRRQLSVTLQAETGLWDVLAPVGTELRPRRGVRYPDGTEEVVPLGRFPIDVQQMGYAADGRTLTLTAPDLMVKIQRARFNVAQASTKGALISAQIATLAAGGLPGAAVTNTATDTSVMGSVVWERERFDAIKTLAASIGADVSITVDGAIWIRDLPTDPTPPAVWTIASGEAGVLADATRTRSRQRTYSAVVALSEVADGTIKLSPQTARDNTPTSPTYYLGDFGFVPYFLASPFFRSTTQMRIAARAMLPKVSSLESQFQVSAGTVNPALDAYDTIAVVLPAESVTSSPPAELHLVESTSVPLVVSDGQQVTTRSMGPSTVEVV